MTIHRAFQLMRLDKNDIDPSVIKSRYRELAKQLHPDTEGGSDEAFTELQAAYECALNFLIIRQTAIDSANSRAEDPSRPRTSGRSPSAPSDSFDPNAHLYYEHTVAQHRRYLNFEGVGYGSTSQRQRQYAIHKLERAFDRVSEYRANKLFDEAAAEHEKGRERGKVSEQEEKDYAVAQVAMKHQRQAKRKATETRKVEEMIDAAMQDWATEAPTLSAFGRPFNAEELMTGAGSSQDILTQRLNRILKNSGYVPEWVSGTVPLSSSSPLSVSLPLSSRPSHVLPVVSWS